MIDGYKVTIIKKSIFIDLPKETTIGVCGADYDMYYLWKPRGFDVVKE